MSKTQLWLLEVRMTLTAFMIVNVMLEVQGLTENGLLFVLWPVWVPLLVAGVLLVTRLIVRYVVKKEKGEDDV